MLCPLCNYSNDDRSVFCENCGNRLTPSAPPPTAQPPQSTIPSQPPYTPPPQVTQPLPPQPPYTPPPAQPYIPPQQAQYAPYVQPPLTPPPPKQKSSAVTLIICAVILLVSVAAAGTVFFVLSDRNNNDTNTRTASASRDDEDEPRRTPTPAPTPDDEGDTTPAFVIPGGTTAIPDYTTDDPTPPPAATPAPAPDLPDNSTFRFMVSNGTGADIVYLYMSPSDYDNWDEDMLEDGVLEDGESVSLTLTGYGGKRYWDLLVEGWSENYAEIYNVDIQGVGVITLTVDAAGYIVAGFDNGNASIKGSQFVTDTPSAATPTPTASSSDQLILNNHTGYALYYIYMTSSDNDSWGSDLLGSGVVMDGDTYIIEIPGMRNTQYWDLRIVDENDNDGQWIEMDLFDMTVIDLYLDDDGEMSILYS